MSALAIAGVTCLSPLAAGAATGNVLEFPVPTSDSEPLEIVSGADGGLWFTEAKANKIARISPSPPYTIQEYPVPTPGAQPQGITAMPTGDIWFTEFLGNKIGRIESGGDHRIREYAIPSAASSPWGLTVGPDRNIWFAESWTAKIGRLDPSTGAVAEFRLPDSGFPRHLANGPDGRLWFTAAAKIGQISPTAPQSSIRLFSTPAAHYLPADLAVGPDQRLWFTEGGGAIGQLDTAAPAQMREFSVPAPGAADPLGITAARDGGIWFTDDLNEYVGRVDPSTGSIAAFPLPRGRPAADVVSGPDGNLWLTSTEGNSVLRVHVDPPDPCAIVNSGGRHLSAAFLRNDGARLTIRYGERPRVTGRLTDDLGHPLAHQQICVVEAARSTPGRRRYVWTNATGRFGYRPQRGPSRTLSFISRQGTSVASKTLRLAVRVVPRLSAHPSKLTNGQRVRFVGRLPSPVPRTGVLTELQVVLGRHWQTFATVRTTPRGRFRFRYRFRRTVQTVTFRFRAQVPRFPNYPYLTGHSRAVRVTVRGR